MLCKVYRPDHNGECLNCDGLADEHATTVDLIQSVMLCVLTFLNAGDLKTEDPDAYYYIKDRLTAIVEYPPQHPLDEADAKAGRTP